MIVVPLQAIPNQSLSIQLNNTNFDLNIHSCNTNPNSPGTSIMAIDIVAAGNPIVSGQRMVNGWPLIPYNYLQNFGNFFMITDNSEYPDYLQFNSTQFLVYVSPSELSLIQEGAFVIS